MPEPKPSKTLLRSALRLRRQALSTEEQLAAAQAVTYFIATLQGWPEANRIALYLAADGEVDTTPLSDLARTMDKQLFLPVIQHDNSLSFAAWHRDDTLSTNRFGIPEPPATARRCPANDLDIVFLPVVGWDAQGGRLGMGGGFYDRTLSGISGPLLVGLAHTNQKVDHIPREKWDIPLNFIATDTALHRSQGAI